MTAFFRLILTFTDIEPHPMKPREKLAFSGPESLSDEELLTIVIGSGTSGLSARQIAAGLLEYASGSLSRLAGMIPTELCTVKGVGQATAVEIAACFEIARRAGRESATAPLIKCPEDIFEAMRAEMTHLNHEEFWVLHLAASGKLLFKQKVSQGGLSGATVDQRMIFRRAYGLGTDSIILCHNHPSGSLSISQEDIRITQAIRNSCALLGFRLTDHLVIAGAEFTSMAERGLL